MTTSDDNSKSDQISCSLVNLVGPSLPNRVLFVDDEEIILRAFSRDMRDSGIELTIARSAAEGLAAFKEKRHNLVMSDYMMPGMDGFHFLSEVRNIAPDTVRILVSGRSDLESIVQLVNEVGLFKCIVKPWDYYEMRDTIRSGLEQYSLTIENRRLNSQLGNKVTELGFTTTSLENEVQVRTTSLLLGLVNALDLRDTETQWHSRRVAIYARRLADALGIEGDECLTVERGALLHDVGKIGVSDTILLKPGKLTKEEWDEMKRHSEYGYRILERIDFLGDARRIVWEHHERWDGKGYPRGLKGEEAYIGARIFAVIDTYDAMTSDRPYRKALPHEVAAEEIVKMTGTQFDPQVAEVWSAIDKEEIQAMRNSVSDPTAGLD